MSGFDKKAAKAALKKSAQEAADPKGKRRAGPSDAAESSRPKKALRETITAAHMASEGSEASGSAPTTDPVDSETWPTDFDAGKILRTKRFRRKVVSSL